MLTDDEIETFEDMVRLARFSVYARRDPNLVRWFYAHASPERVATYRRLYATNAEVRRACDAAYRDELRNLSEPHGVSAKQDAAEPHGVPTGGERNIDDV